MVDRQSDLAFIRVWDEEPRWLDRPLVGQWQLAATQAGRHDFPTSSSHLALDLRGSLVARCMVATAMWYEKVP
jgi:hypothetical protein